MPRPFLFSSPCGFEQAKWLATSRAILFSYTCFMQRKVFWLAFAALGLIADLILPFWWAVAATIPCGMAACGSPTAPTGFNSAVYCHRPPAFERLSDILAKLNS